MTSPQSATAPAGDDTGVDTDKAQWQTADLDLSAYLDRIGYDGPRTATLDTLRAVHRAHMSTLSFTNLDLFLGRGNDLEMRNLADRIVGARRGGYCFEQNLLLAAALEGLGFSVDRQLARVRRGSTKVRARTHAVLLVESDGRRWLADVGFGDEGLIEPIPFEDGAELTVGEWTWRVDLDGDEWVLRSRHPDRWFDVYSLRLEHHFRADFDEANHFTATYPLSTFVGRLIAQRGDDRIRQTLLNRELTTQYPDGRRETRELSDAEVVTALRDVFHLGVTGEDEAPLRAALDAARPRRS
ncbi:arylamine N-acetyltransferase [Streptomyces sp. NPDC012888]|uniref:arylamine N-acetyltransferase family protein n=1 Tax=Streptomyces sp. NPDC012888 TaxID=3364855 RepID=UPI0036AF9F27